MSIGGAVTTGGVTPSAGVRAGGAFVEYHAKDFASKKIDDIKKKNKELEQSVESVSSKYAKWLGGMAAKGGFVGAILGGSELPEIFKRAGVELGKYVLGVNDLEAAAKRASEQLGELGRRQLENIRDRNSRASDEISAMGNIPSHAIGRAVEEVKRLKTELSGSKNTAEALQKAFNGMSPFSSKDNALIWANPFDGMSFEQLKNDAATNLKSAKDNTEEYRKSLEKLEAQLRKLRNPGPDLSLGGDAAAMLAGLDFAGRTRGMSADRVALERLRERESKSLRAGGRSADLDRIERAIEDKEFVDRMDLQAKTFERFQQAIDDVSKYGGSLPDRNDFLRARDRGELSALQADKLWNQIANDKGGMHPALMMGLNAAAMLGSSARSSVGDIDRLVRGGFNASAAGQQFTVAEQRLKEQTDLLKEIKTNTGGIGDQVVQALKVL